MSIALQPGGILVNGQPVIIRSSSLFYFRIPRGLWRDRMIKIRNAGYNALDVYFPWNYHELAEGKWNFHGERDIAEFLHIAGETGLWVIARPGPYICSEWDGGGLPAYLLTKSRLKLRDNDSRYLRYVSRWMDRILPILEPFQIQRGGSVITVQLENELDFFDCQDRTGYMHALYDMARSSHIIVPLIACAGQGDLRGATGGVPGILPTVNIYTDDADPGVEQRAFLFSQRMQPHGHPLMVTETNRTHFFLRRLISAGAKLVGPYLQTGGVNFGFTASVNNWGQPLAFVASDYDFGGMIAADGSLRDDFREAVLLNRSIETYGAALALATVVRLPAGTLRGSLPVVDDGPYALELNGGGLLISLPNITGQSQQASLRLGELTFPLQSTLVIPPASCPFLPVHMDLSQWGFPGTLVYSTAELAVARPGKKRLSLIFYTPGAGEIGLSLPAKMQSSLQGIKLSQVNEWQVLNFEANAGPRAVLTYADGRELAIYGLDPQTAARADIDEKGELVIAPEIPPSIPAQVMAQWFYRPMIGLTNDLDWKPVPAGTRAPSLESMGILRGWSWYHCSVCDLDGQPVKGYLIEGAADVVSLYSNGAYIATVTPGGGSAYLPAVNQAITEPLELEARIEIWGHSNFEDSRLPALHLDSPRGLKGLVAVLQERDLTPNWSIHLLEEAEGKELYTAEGLDTDTWPLVSFPNWLSTRSPNRVCYRKHVTIDDSPVDRWILHFQGLTRPVEVSVDGSAFTRVTPYDPFVDITDWVRLGQPLGVVIYVEQDYQGQIASRVLLLEGKACEDWRVAGLEEAGLVHNVAHAASPKSSAPAGFPIQVAPGELGLLWSMVEQVHPDDQDYELRFEGRNAKLSVFLNDRLIARIWLDPDRKFPRVAGGDPTLAYLPSPWWQTGENRLAVLIESIDAQDPASVEIVS